MRKPWKRIWRYYNHNGCYVGSRFFDEVPRKKAFASSIERSELLSNLASSYKLGKKHKYPFMGGGAVDVRERMFSASLDTRQ